MARKMFIGVKCDNPECRHGAAGVGPAGAFVEVEPSEVARGSSAAAVTNAMRRQGWLVLCDSAQGECEYCPECWPAGEIRGDLVGHSSSQIRRTRYDDQSMLLEVEFAGGAKYLYRNVPAFVVEDVRNAPSIGKAFNAKIKKGGYAYKKMG